MQIGLGVKFGLLVRAAERCLDQDFSEVRLDLQPATALGGLARTIGSTISLSHEAAHLPATSVDFILAHELAHVVQKRLGSRAKQAGLARPTHGDHVAAIEREADAAAAAILSGSAMRCVLPDDPARPAHWGELGHYYTSYFVMLKAGVDPKKARVRAFFCQLPDQVWQFDATGATRDYNEAAPEDSDYGLKSYAVSAATWFADIKRATPNSAFVYQTQTRMTGDESGVYEIKVKVEDPVARAARLPRDLNVIRGLHCLTGGSSTLETEFRTNVLKQNWTDPVLSGLALHPFGDSFAHRTESDIKVMYGDDHGHLFDGHDPDYVSQRPENYIGYARALYEAIPAEGGKAKLPFAISVEPALRTICEIKIPIPEGIPGKRREMRLSGKGAEDKGLAKMKALLSQIEGYDPSYDPVREGAGYWSTFAVANKAILDEVGGAEAVRTKIMMAGMRWNARQVP